MRSPRTGTKKAAPRVLRRPDTRSRASEGRCFARRASATTLLGHQARRTDGGLVAALHDDLPLEGVEGSRPGGEPERDTRLLVRAAVAAAPERQARDRGCRHREEAAPAPAAAGAERR